MSELSHAFERERAPLRVKYFTAVDVDKTVLNTLEFYNLAIRPSLTTYFEVVEIEERLATRTLDDLDRQIAENDGKAFDIFQFLNEKMREIGAEEIDMSILEEQIIQDNSGENGNIDSVFAEEILAPGALTLLKMLCDDENEAWGFLTTGGLDTQGLKIGVLSRIVEQWLGVTPNSRIISAEHKTQDIELWLGEDNLFHIPYDLTGDDVIVAERIRIIDDKLKNLQRQNQRLKDRIMTLLAKRPRGESEPGAESLVVISHKIDESRPVA